MSPERETLIRGAWKVHRREILARINGLQRCAWITHEAKILLFTIDLVEVESVILARIVCEGLVIVQGALIHG